MYTVENDVDTFMHACDIAINAVDIKQAPILIKY